MTIDRDKLTQPFPRSAIKQRQAGGGRMLDYIEGHAVIHRLNDATDNCWDMEVKDISSKEIGQNTLMIARVALHIPGLGTREGLGVQMVHERGGEDLVKGCITDALKKAATLFGVGLELYGPDYEAGDVAPVSQSGRAQPRDSAPPPVRAPVAPLRQEPAQTGRIAAGQQQAIIRMCDELGYTTEDRIAADFNKGSLSMLTQEEAGDLITALDKELRAHRAQLRMMADSPTGSSHFATA
jgi:hypothetical protein